MYFMTHCVLSLPENSGSPDFLFMPKKLKFEDLNSKSVKHRHARNVTLEIKQTFSKRTILNARFKVCCIFLPE